MFKYTIKAYSNFGEIGGINAVHVVVTAPNEEAAIGKARTIVQRENYAVLVIEDLRGTEIKTAIGMDPPRVTLPKPKRK